MTTQTNLDTKEKEFDEALEKIATAVSDKIFNAFTQNERDEVRAWAAENRLAELRPTVAPVIVHYVRETTKELILASYRAGTLEKLPKDALGTKTLITKFDAAGRIAEMVKLPLTLRERLALEKSTSGTATR